MGDTCLVRIAVFRKVEDSYGCGVELMDCTTGELIKIMSVHLLKKDFSTVTSLYEHLAYQAVAEIKDDYKTFVFASDNDCFLNGRGLKRRLAVLLPSINIVIKHTKKPKSSCIRLGIDAALKKRTIIEKF